MAFFVNGSGGKKQNWFELLQFTVVPPSGCKHIFVGYFII